MLENGTESPHDEETVGISGVDCTIGLVLFLFSIFIIAGNVLVIQVIRNQTRKGVCDFIFAQISFVHIFGGFTALVSAFILMSGRSMFEYGQVDDVLCWFSGVVWHLVVLLTPMFLCLVLVGRLVIHFAPQRYLMIGCFAGPLLLMELLLIILLLCILVNFEIFKKEKKKEEPKTFIQAGLRTILAQTMVPLPTVTMTLSRRYHDNSPTVFEGSEQEPVKSAGLQQASFFTTNTATPSQSSNQDLEQNKEIFRFVV
ncbi:hypothetical protein ACHWQZ_G013195 [Mnemiopsis leidyi]